MPDSARSDEMPTGALSGVRVVDAATIYAAPLLATLLGDFGADVIKVEHPKGDGLRKWNWVKNNESLWWAFAGRNKRSLSLSLADPRGAEVLRQLLTEADVFVENFRPGTLERWDLAPEDLLALNPRLVIVRVSGYGQTGPYSSQPGFGTLAEALSGFAATNGAEDGPPTLPQWPLADGVAALAGAFATMTALRHAERTGQGQVVDVSIYEPLFWILGAQTTAFDQLGVIPRRRGSSTEVSVPRECFETADGRWVALSGATAVTAERIMRAVGGDDIADAEWFSDVEERVAHRDSIHAVIAQWVRQRSRAEVLERMRSVGATVGPVYSIDDIVTDEHFLQRGSVTTVDHPELGPIKMQGLVARLTRTPGCITSPGAELGVHSDEILAGQLGMSSEEIAALRQTGIVGEAPDSVAASPDR